MHSHDQHAASAHDGAGNGTADTQLCSRAVALMQLPAVTEDKDKFKVLDADAANVTHVHTCSEHVESQSTSQVSMLLSRPNFRSALISFDTAHVGFNLDQHR